MKIHEVAQRLGLTPRTIRFYEEKGLLAPAKQPDNGYRRFSEADVWRLATAAALREVGMRLEDIRRLIGELEKDNADEAGYLLELQRSAMFAQWLELREMIGTLDRMIEESAGDAGGGGLAGSRLYELSDRLRRLKERRSEWIDRWNFDALPALAGSGQPDLTGHVPPPAEYGQALDMAVQWVAPRPGEAGLDIGTGTGALAERLMRHGARMVGVDQSRRMLRHCKSRLPGLTTRLGNFLTLPCFDAQFDFVVSSFALHHLSEEQHPLALEEMDRVLKDRGRLCIVDAMIAGDEGGTAHTMTAADRGEAAPAPKKIGIDGEQPADRDRLVRLLQAKGFVAIRQRVAGDTHIIYAVKTTS
ncbi:MerR family transcriptional regulator [Paenibacillus hamazuiensis]|uniref:MerR family transcriptional regulator n=1 Tax=Paenibacillus hamazuiensis TaxID=2936508 RepID=UPI00201065DF|nr:MerR family transcriptional regulator [Paenibacillus hamazuiensis]